MCANFLFDGINNVVGYFITDKIASINNISKVAVRSSMKNQHCSLAQIFNVLQMTLHFQIS